jgi:Yip1 domain
VLGPIALAAVAFVVGAVSVGALYGMGALYCWAGHILGGSADAAEVRAAIAWGQVPGIYITIFVVLTVILGLNTPTTPPSVSIYGLIEAVGVIWAAVISLKCLAEVHGFSAWRALGTIVLAAVGIAVVLIGIALTIGLAVVVSRALA